MVEDFNNQANAVVAEIGGRRLIIGGGADGWIYALRAETGELQWKFRMSQKSLNSPVTVVGNTVYATSNGEPVDGNFLGQIVALDGTGSGDVTATARIWNHDAVMAGFAAPVFDAGRLYIVDDAANLQGVRRRRRARLLFETNLGTVGRAAPLLADGKLYATEVNGHVTILKPLADRFEVLDKDALTIPRAGRSSCGAASRPRTGGCTSWPRTGSTALGDKAKPFPRPARAARRRPPAARAPLRGRGGVGAGGARRGAGRRPARISPSRCARSTPRGKPVRVPAGAAFTLEGLKGTVSADGRFRPDPAAGNQAGKIKAAVGGKEAVSRVRVFAPLPWSEDFEGGKVPGYFLGAGRFTIADLEGSKVLHKAPVQTGLNRGIAFIGPASMPGYTHRGRPPRARSAAAACPTSASSTAATRSTCRATTSGSRCAAGPRSSPSRSRSSSPGSPTSGTACACAWSRPRRRSSCAARSGRRRSRSPPRGRSNTRTRPGSLSGAPGLYADSSTDLDIDNVQVMVNR